ncbi:MAG: hypothetical protein E7165_00920 [Firmicutes bacterium]|nr:hypothetical protein [Bacillota bacterium]
MFGILFKWKIEKIMIMPFGGLTIFKERINLPIIEEVIVCIAGPIFQIIYYVLICKYVDIRSIHYNLLIFNLLPIVPLDGSKLLNLFLNKIFPFKLGLYLTNYFSIIISFIFLIIIFYTEWNLILFLTMVLLVFKTLCEIKNINYLFNKFLLERYIEDIGIKKFKYIHGINFGKMYRDYKHIFIINKKPYTEREIIRKRFDLERKIW